MHTIKKVDPETGGLRVRRLPFRGDEGRHRKLMGPSYTRTLRASIIYRH